MRPFTVAVVAMLIIFLQIGYVWAQDEKSDSERIRKLEEELSKMQEEQDRLQTALEDFKKNQESALLSKKEPSKLPFKLGTSITVRYDHTEVEDQTDLLLGDNEIDGFRARVRFSAEYNPDGRLGAGLRISTGETPNPTSPFIRMGDFSRSKSFNLDQFFIVYRPFKFFEDLSFTVGKMPQPFWRGGRGTWRSELVWDDDVNPEGAVLQTSIPTGIPGVRIENTGGYFIVDEVTDNRFAGLTGDIYLLADQLKIQVEPVAVAAAVYHYNHLNAGLRAPNFDPGSGAFISPGTNALLFQDGLQQTNNRVNYGPGANGFVKDQFTLVNITGQAYLSIPAGWLESLKLASLEPEVFVVGDYVTNTSLALDKNGYSVTGGIRGGGKGIVGPFNLWYTYRNVDADATLATFTDSDLGAGTAYKGFEFGANYRLLPDLMVQFSYFDFEGFPRKDNSVTRWFIDVVRTF